MQRFVGKIGCGRTQLAALAAPVVAAAVMSVLTAAVTAAVTVLGATFAPAANAQVYKWVDANGVTHYGERPQGNAKAKPVELRDASPQS